MPPKGPKKGKKKKTTTEHHSQNVANPTALPPPLPNIPIYSSNLPPNPLQSSPQTPSSHQTLLHGLSLFSRKDALLHTLLHQNALAKSTFLLSLQSPSSSTFDLKKYSESLQKLERSTQLQKNVDIINSPNPTKYARKIPKLKRPPNAFMLFKTSRLKLLSSTMFPKGDKRGTIQYKTSVIASEWRDMGEVEREEWTDKAREMGEEYGRKRERERKESGEKGRKEGGGGERESESESEEERGDGSSKKKAKKR
ncbi:hypothetical protein TrVE_jg11885 [Triparma verrucosa]|uniref:HMG box domain-containing protein n=1 Tax=Triparma verrucosa TaxID=1606542 RepID=A0A9W7EY00_9STRA|nr:hypothetical protein TrVE_jg11885 [Triparma verrucosa]